ncbi:hypothetical protein U8V72_21025 [Priestia filamentosa]|uniref:hypothetical protein n=1 Tax=Priestia filamentosa TaxID=1402861 RepID=UPI00397E7FC7
MQSAKEKNLKFAANKDEQISLFQDNNGLTLNPNFLYGQPAKIMPKYLNDLDNLHVGDKIKVTIKHTKKTFIGYFETKGFHDGRDQDNFRYYYLKVMQEEGKDGESFREFFNDSKVELLESYRTTGYKSPNKSEVAEKMEERLRNSSFDNYINIYREVEEEYPYLSFEWRPVIRDAWESVPLKTANEEEMLDYFKESNKESGQKIQKPLEEVFKEICTNYIGDERLEKLHQLRWIENNVIEKCYKINFKDYSYFRVLKQHVIKNTQNVDLCLEIIGSWSMITEKLIEENAPEDTDTCKKGKFTLWYSKAK